MRSREPSVSVVDEAQQALQVANALHHIHDRFEHGGWTRGQRAASHGRSCIVGAIEEATRWTMTGVDDAIVSELVAQLPPPLRLVAGVNPRVALMIYNEAPGGERRIRKLLIDSLPRLGMGGTLEPAVHGPAAARPRAPGTG